MASDWEADSDNETKVTSPPQAKVAAKLPARTKFEGEDQDGSEPASDWEESSDDDEEKPASAPVAPPKKKGTLKAKLAEKEAQKAARKAAGEDDIDSEDEFDPKEKAKRDKEREIKADLNNAADLFGAVALGGELDALVSFQPRTKEDFEKFSAMIIEYVVKKHQSKPLYQAFVEHHVRQLAMPLKDVEVRKAASGLTTLANEKQKEQRDKASGKKKPKTVAKPVLGSSKVANKFDTNLYEEALDDFGTNADDFM
ncbi:translation initiation factor eIF3 subunit [Pluteus cervinus]|uniref:Translation initiation factor eIF3 subunit n=1 Tax=Pluteus cervinus TaxID=181527 RepID=A0ACD3AZE9_9AGAR|nr:translation initiation factor eIF3 subunit [Pluteus cervinus]